MFIVIWCGHSYVILQWWLILHNDYIACSGYFRLSVYMWGFLLTYICRRLSSWLRFHVFWEAGHDKEEAYPLYRNSIKFSWTHLFLWLLLFWVFCVIHFGVEFCFSYRNSEEAFWSRHIHLIRIGTTISNRHICSVGTGATIMNRCIRSPNRHIYLAETGCPRTDTSIRSERAKSFRIDMYVRRIETFIHISLSMLD